MELMILAEKYIAGLSSVSWVAQCLSWEALAFAIGKTRSYRLDSDK